MPVELALLMDDGSTQRVRLPVEIWGLRNTYTALIPGPKKVNSVVIDPDRWYPDVDRSNNRWPVAPAGAAAPTAAPGPPAARPAPPGAAPAAPGAAGGTPPAPTPGAK